MYPKVGKKASQCSNSFTIFLGKVDQTETFEFIFTLTNNKHN
jgi:hypothetical protein